jgi:uncharacterized protein (TIGR03435 family)
MNPSLLLIAAILQLPPQFEVASVRSNNAGGRIVLQTPPNGRVNIVNATMNMLMTIAYDLPDYRIVGGPDWLASSRFDIQARPAADFRPQPPCTAANCPESPVQLMMQTLLADRFQLKIHRETRELPVYELTVAKNALKLKQVDPPSLPTSGDPPTLPLPAPGPAGAVTLPKPPPGPLVLEGPGMFAASAMPFEDIPHFLSRLFGRPVIDKTGITGFYDVNLQFAPEGFPGGVADAQAADPAPSIFTALQEQLGLRLDSAKGPVEVLVIDNVRKPTEN